MLVGRKDVVLGIECKHPLVNRVSCECNLFLSSRKMSTSLNDDELHFVNRVAARALGITHMTRVDHERQSLYWFGYLLLIGTSADGSCVIQLFQ